jgi:hypothetical protein
MAGSNPHSLDPAMGVVSSLAALLTKKNFSVPAPIGAPGLGNLAKAGDYVEHQERFHKIIQDIKGGNTTHELGEELLDVFQQMLDLDVRKAQTDLEKAEATLRKGGRRTRRRKTKHRKSRRRRVRGGRLPVFENLGKKGDEVTRLVNSIRAYVQKDDALGAVSDYKALIDLVGKSEAERLLMDIPPAELAKILQA